MQAAAAMDEGENDDSQIDSALGFQVSVNEFDFKAPKGNTYMKPRTRSDRMKSDEGEKGEQDVQM